MLVEDHDRGKTVHCLICKTAIRLTSINKDKGNGKEKK
jgi:hypothetical protein